MSAGITRREPPSCRVLSLVVSSPDSALLAPATVLAQNLLRPQLEACASVLTLTRLSVLGFGVASAALAG